VPLVGPGPDEPSEPSPTKGLPYP